MQSTHSIPAPMTLCKAVCVPRLPLDVGTFVSYVLPLVIGYFVVAVLAVTPRTHALRVLLWPAFTSVAWRAAAIVDVSSGRPDRQIYNTVFVFFVVFMVTRTFDLTSTKTPLVRHLSPAERSRSTVTDAPDLALTFRGHGWDWSSGVHIPRETRPTSRRGFTSHVVLSAVAHFLLSDVLHRTVLSFSPAGLGSRSGGSIFDDALPFHMRYLRSSVIVVLAATCLYAILHACYDACTVLAVLVFGQDPARWPPPFDAPHRATSLSDFWGRRWHQFLRRMFLLHGGHPLSSLFGPPGLVLGAFLASGVFHHLALRTLDGRAELWRMLVGFGMMAPGILAERAFRRATGRRVAGWPGWAWTMAWLLLWGNVLVDGFARAGTFGHTNLTQGCAMLGHATVERWVASFDRWLYAIVDEGG